MSGWELLIIISTHLYISINKYFVIVQRWTYFLIQLYATTFKCTKYCMWNLQYCWPKQFLLQYYTTKCYEELKSTVSHVLWYKFTVYITLHWASSLRFLITMFHLFFMIRHILFLKNLDALHRFTFVSLNLFILMLMKIK